MNQIKEKKLKKLQNVKKSSQSHDLDYVMVTCHESLVWKSVLLLAYLFYITVILSFLKSERERTVTVPWTFSTISSKALLRSTWTFLGVLDRLGSGTVNGMQRSYWTRQTVWNVCKITLTFEFQKRKKDCTKYRHFWG